MNLREFVRSSGGGGSYEYSEKLGEKVFHVKDTVRVKYKSNESKQTVAYGNLLFDGNKEVKPYILVPWSRPNFLENPNLRSGSNRFADPQAVLFYIQNVWRLAKPKLLISISGGLKDFTTTNPKIERFLDELMETARKTKSWIITAGIASGVIKSIGKQLL